MQQKQSLALIFKEAMKKVSKAALKLYVCNTYIDIVKVLNKTHRKCQIANSLRKINFSQLENKIM